MKTIIQPMHDMNTSIQITPQGNSQVKSVFKLGLAVDLWRWRTGRCSLAELGLLTY